MSEARCAGRCWLVTPRCRVSGIGRASRASCIGSIRKRPACCSPRAATKPFNVSCARWSAKSSRSATWRSCLPPGYPSRARSRAPWRPTRHTRGGCACSNPVSHLGYSRHKVTRYRIVRVALGRALLEVRVGSAFRHQIRAHLAAVGHPIAGDAVYGGEPVAALGARHALHASRLNWPGDADVAGFSVSEPLPAELAQLLGE